MTSREIAQRLGGFVVGALFYGCFGMALNVIFSWKMTWPSAFALGVGVGAVYAVLTLSYDYFAGPNRDPFDD